MCKDWITILTYSISHKNPEERYPAETDIGWWGEFEYKSYRRIQVLSICWTICHNFTHNMTFIDTIMMYRDPNLGEELDACACMLVDAIEHEDRFIVIRWLIGFGKD